MDVHAPNADRVGGLQITYRRILHQGAARTLSLSTAKRPRITARDWIRLVAPEAAGCELGRIEPMLGLVADYALPAPSLSQVT